MSDSENSSGSAGMAYLGMALFMLIIWGLYNGEMKFVYWNISLLTVVGIVNQYFASE